MPVTVSRATLPILLLILSIVLFAFVVTIESRQIGRSFPGYLTFRNGVVGAFYVPGWSGPERGFHYHDIAPSVDSLSHQPGEIFSKKDYALVVLVPAVTGLLFLLLGIGISFLFPADAGRMPLILFHGLVGNYLIVSPHFHLSADLWFLHLIFVSLIPATIIHFGLLFPKPPNNLNQRSTLVAAYGVGFAILAPYLSLFMKNPAAWMVVETVVVSTLVFAYLFWIVRLLFLLLEPQSGPHRTIARYLLAGQIIGFIVPLCATIAIFVWKYPVPMNLAAPVVLLFPAALFVGTVLGRLKQNQIRLVQTEKMATLGNLVAGLAHELNNPLTFVYSNVEPLKELIDSLKGVTDPIDKRRLLTELDSLAGNIDEGATRAKSIVDNFRDFARPAAGETSTVNLHDLLDRSLNVLSHKWKDRINVVRDYGNLPPVAGNSGELGQAFLNILANACEAIAGRGEIRIATGVKGGYVQIRIRDDGCGMTTGDLKRAFDPFFTTKPQGEGTGLGLALTQQVIGKHRGTIEMISERGKGTEVVVALPL